MTTTLYTQNFATQTPVDIFKSAGYWIYCWDNTKPTILDSPAVTTRFTPDVCGMRIHKFATDLDYSKTGLYPRTEAVLDLGRKVDEQKYLLKYQVVNYMENVIYVSMFQVMSRNPAGGNSPVIQIGINYGNIIIRQQSFETGNVLHNVVTGIPAPSGTVFNFRIEYTPSVLNGIINVYISTPTLYERLVYSKIGQTAWTLGAKWTIQYGVYGDRDTDDQVVASKLSVQLV